MCCGSWGRKESDTTEATQQQQQQHIARLFFPFPRAKVCFQEHSLNFSIPRCNKDREQGKPARNKQTKKKHISHQEDMMPWLSGPVRCMKRVFVFVLGV